MKYLLVFTLALLSSRAISQNEGLVNNALEAYKQGSFIEAKSLIDESITFDENDVSPKVWNFRGHIYKQLYKNSIQDQGASYRDEAVASFKKSCELSADGQYYPDNIKALEYLSATYFNDAVDSVLKLKYNGGNNPVQFFQKFKALKLWLKPQEGVKAEELMFLKMLAQSYEKIHTKHDSEDRESILKSISYYEQALGLDAQDYEANFNLAIIHYNEGARLIGRISYKTGMEELISIQTRCVEYFRHALPFMEKAESLRPNRVESLKGLMFINRALNNFDIYLEYKSKLDEILNN